ncbi:MAG TPA: hypothetical protein VMU86_05405, partial [Steroidobacteraceae bacterium]|nr:hypothetical protein [Steroidobacteraceae bacterium]
MLHTTDLRALSRRRCAPRAAWGALLRGSALAATLAAAGCAVYHPLPLPRGPELAARLPGATPRPLDMNEVATLAVLNNPDLNTARAQLGVASAQAFAAGILP